MESPIFSRIFRNFYLSELIPTFPGVCLHASSGWVRLTLEPAMLCYECVDSLLFSHQVVILYFGTKAPTCARPIPNRPMCQVGQNSFISVTQIRPYRPVRLGMGNGPCVGFKLFLKVGIAH